MAQKHKSKKKLILPKKNQPLLETSTNKQNRILTAKNIDLAIFAVLILTIFFLALSLPIANITHDSVDYYVILQKIVSPNENPVVVNPFFVEQRAPGYSIFSIPSYILLDSIETVFFKEKIIYEDKLNGTEILGFTPNKVIQMKDIFLKRIYLQESSSWFDWKIITALFFTSLFFLGIGICYLVKLLLFLKKKNSIGAISLIGIIILSSPIFVQNIIQTPTYATLCAFGLICAFSYFFIKSYYEKDSIRALIAGVLLSFLSITRFEGIVLGLALIIILFLYKEKFIAKKILNGFVLTLPLFIVYNSLMFHNVFQFAFLKGDLNKIMLDPSFVFNALLSPSSGLIFFSPLIVIGCLGLFLSDKKPLKILGLTSLIYIILICIRVPVICTCQEGELVKIGLEQVICSVPSCVQLIQSDINRYLILLVPFALIGLQNLFYTIKNKLIKKKQLTE
jgi:hypothetical protein